MSRRYQFPQEFLEKVRTMPLIEAEELLRDRRREVLAQLMSAPDPDKIDLGYVLSAINDEIALVVDKRNRVRVGQAVRDCFGAEGFEQWRIRMAQLEQEVQA